MGIVGILEDVGWASLAIAGGFAVVIVVVFAWLVMRK